MCMGIVLLVHNAECVSPSLEHKEEGDSEALHKEQSAVTYRDALEHSWS
jgi:hypothetical protein